ncbi:MAG: peroxiredoxin [halophilic archaeon J07HX5]|jgi:Peroxiredoxin|nr:MAG: peroxiredoxin [halophilic archaeon J07HX5]
MISEGDTIPSVTQPLVGEEIAPVSVRSLSDGPLVLAFFPGAFTSVCTHEMASLDERHDELIPAGGRLVGVSVDAPFALRAFRDELELSFALLSDSTRELVRACELTTDHEAVGVDEIAQRAVVVADSTGTVSYVDVVAPSTEPDYDALLAAVAATN